MAQNWTFGRKLTAGFALSGITLLLVAWVGLQSTDTLIDNNVWVEHTHEVRRNVAELLTLMVDAETGQRGYVITGKEEFLEPYRLATSKIEAALVTLKSLTADNPEQQRRLTVLSDSIDDRLDHLNKNLELRKTSGLEIAAAAITTGEGKDQMDRMRGLMNEVDHTEAELLRQRTTAAEASAARAKTVIQWGSLLGAMMVALIGFLITTSVSAQIGAAVHHIQSSSAELQAAANQQATGAREQATSMSEITTTINELLATSRQIAESAQRVAQIADQTAGAARTGDVTVERASDAVGAIRKQVDLVVHQMLELGKKSQQIGAVLDIVSELAEQTNILAINATIEAAGAGETGRRFAVVADEIRKLADRVAGSTKEIRALIEDVRGAVNATVMVTETGSKAVDAGSQHFGDVAASFGKIGVGVTTTTEAAREIQLSTTQQTTAVEQVNLAITNAAQATRENEASSEQTLRTASQLAELSRQLIRLVQPRAHTA